MAGCIPGRMGSWKEVRGCGWEEDCRDLHAIPGLKSAEPVFPGRPDFILEEFYQEVCLSEHPQDWHVMEDRKDVR